MKQKRVFVAGATGVLGRRVVELLVSQGHAVTGVARSAVRAEGLQESGAEPVEIDLFDPHAVRGAVRGHDAVMGQVDFAQRLNPPGGPCVPCGRSQNRYSY